MPKGLLDLWQQVSSNPVTSNPATYSIGSGGGSTPVNYNPQGTYTGTPMELSAADAAGLGGVPQRGRVGNFPFQSVSQYSGDYRNRDTSTGGGFFSLMDLFDSQAAARGRDNPALAPGNATTRGMHGGNMNAPGSPGSNTPNAFQSGQGSLSTNNYRLLPQPYRKPGYIMRNGLIISTDPNPAEYAPGVPVYGSGGTDVAPTRNMLRSGAHEGMPANTLGASFWPGQLSAGYGTSYQG